MSTENTNPDHAARGHHPYSPSTLGTREESPCFKPREGTNEAAQRGTLQHEAVEARSDEVGLSDEEAAAVARALSMVDNLKALIKTTFEEFTEVSLPVDEEVITSASGEVWTGTTAGFPDRVIVWRPEGYAENERHAALFDWKFGRYGVPKAIENRQGHAYALGMRKLLADRGLVLKTIQVTFFSPHRDEEPTSHTFRENDFDRLYAELVTIVRRSETIDKALEARGFSGLTPDEEPLVIASSKCRFCARLGFCAKVGGLAHAIAVKAKPLKVPADVQGFNERDPLVLARDVIVADIVKAWAEERRKRIVGLAIDHPEDDRYVPEGYHLSASYPREVLDEHKLLTFLRKRFGRKIVEELITVPLTKFEKFLGEQAARGEKTAAIELFQQELENAGLTRRAARPTVSLRMK